MTNIDPVMPDESPREYRQALAGLLDAHQPRNQHERMLVEELADANWDWKRARAVDRERWDYVGTSYNRGNAGIAESLFQVPEIRHRPHRNYMVDTERRYYRALSAVERMHRDRERPTSARLRTWTADTLGETAAEPAEQELALPANIVPIDGPTGAETNRSQCAPASPQVVQDEATSAPNAEITKQSQSAPACPTAAVQNEPSSVPDPQSTPAATPRTQPATEKTNRTQSHPESPITRAPNEPNSVPQRATTRAAARPRTQASRTKKRNEPNSQAAAPPPAEHH